MSGRWPCEWPGMHLIILAHSDAIAGWAKKAKPKKSVIKVMMAVLLFISDLISCSCHFLCSPVSYPVKLYISVT